MSTTAASLGLIGLGVMGENLALNFENHGFSVCGFDLDEAKRQQFAQRTQGMQAHTAGSLAELVARLTSPRRILLMVPAGQAVDAVLTDLRPLLAAGDVLIDGGNTLYTDTARRRQPGRTGGQPHQPAPHLADGACGQSGGRRADRPAPAAGGGRCAD